MCCERERECVCVCVCVCVSSQVKSSQVKFVYCQTTDPLQLSSHSSSTNKVIEHAKSDNCSVNNTCSYSWTRNNSISFVLKRKALKTKLHTKKTTLSFSHASNNDILNNEGCLRNFSGM